MQGQKPSLAARLRTGWAVLGLLMVIEVVEYVLGVTMQRGAWLILAPLAIVGAWPIVQFFMHLPQLWHREEE
ncbi:MAG: hypothetical protein HY330_00555 [Chloroflexi bacterium]|nr:hypothetical protein [Chloroflexota bacterium]